MTNERLQQILTSKRTLISVVYGYEAKTLDAMIIDGEEIDALVKELLQLRRRIGNLETTIFSEKRD